jgi:hypothetical protein
MEGMTSMACHKQLEVILMENCAKAMTHEDPFWTSWNLNDFYADFEIPFYIILNTNI